MSNESLKTESAWLLSGLYQGGLFIGNEPVAEKVEAKEIPTEIPAEMPAAVPEVPPEALSEVLPQYKSKFIHWIEEESDFDYKDMISKIMFALKWKGQEIKADDFMFLKSDQMSHSFEDLIKANSFQTERLVFWSNRTIVVPVNQILQVAAPSAVAKDKETKIKYWNQIKSYFGL
jgi:hypothetical protein